MVPAMKSATQHIDLNPRQEKYDMKIKTNVRAGKGGSKSSSSDGSKINNTVVSYVPPVSRCVGI